MVSVRLPEDMEQKLTNLCAATRRSKSFHMKEALECYMDDLEDGHIAMERMMRPHRQYYSSQEVLQQLDD